MKSRNIENADNRRDQEKSCIDDAHHSKSEWYAPKLKRIDINTTLYGVAGAPDFSSPGS